MKKLVALLLTSAMIFAALPISAEKYNPFTDVPESHYAYEEISYLYLNNIVNGKTGTSFEPEAPVKREELAKMLVTSLGETETSAEGAGFDDVAAGSWYEEYVNCAAAAGIFKGVSDTEFSVGTYVTKEDCALAMYRLSEKKPPIKEANTEQTAFADAENISDYAKEAIDILLRRGVLKSGENASFNPQNNATRAEVCQMLYGILTQADKMWDKEQWFNYDKTVENDRLSAQMPKPFDINNYTLKEIGSFDFNGDNDRTFQEGWCPGKWSIQENGGPDDSGCLKIEQIDGTISQYQLYYNDYSAKPGDWYVMSCKIKCENLDTTGKVRPLLSTFKQVEKWLSETQDGKANDSSLKNGEWVERSVMVSIPEVANEIGGDEPFYTIRIAAYMENTAIGSVAYFDDLKLYKVLFEPMETVLITPNYKGLIYGDGGISDVNLRIFINDYNGGYNQDDFKLTSCLVDENDNVFTKSEIEDVADVMDVTFSSDELEMNKDYYVVTKLTSKSTGEVIQTQEWTLRKRPEDFEPYIYFDKYNRMIKDGEPHFPLVMYYGYSNPMTYEKAFDILEDSPVDYLSIGDTFHQSYPTLRTQFLRKRMKEAGAQGKLSMAGYCYSDMYSGIVSQAVDQQTDIRKLLELFCKNFGDDPLLFLYYNWDEPNAVRFGEELRWQNDIMANADINHPTYGVLDKLYEGRIGLYNKTADIIAPDPYPATGGDDADLSAVGDTLKKIPEIAPNKPYGIVLQGFWFKNRGDKSGPTEQEYRNMAWQAICEGVSMLDSYALGDAAANPWGDKSFDELIEEEMLVYSEIDYMSPILLSRLPMPHYELRGEGDWLNHMSRRYEGKSYMFMVNNSGTARQCGLYLDGVKKIKGMYTDKEYTADDSGWFKISLDPHEVEIFEYEQEDYLSSHAELIRFGVSNKDRSYLVINADGEMPTIMLDDNSETLDYCATVSDYAKVYINGEEVSASGNINISGKNEILVKVVSQDGRFSSEKKYYISRT